MEGTRVSHYEVLEQLGRGGMGVVHKALDTRLNRHVALKFLPPEMTSDDEARQRFTTEAQAASALDHPNICTIYEIDSDPDGRMFIAMAFYDGETLKQRIDRGPLAIGEALEIASQCARGLAKAHAAGIVHRDVKPANVMITGDGLAKVLDFGIAKLAGVTRLTKTGSTLGTASYMSPEQVHGEDVGAESDVWSLGAVLYEMLSGEQAFDAANAMALMHVITSEAPAPLRSLRPEVPAEVEAVVMRALEKAPADRFASAEELAGALERCLPRASSVVAPSGGVGRTARWWGGAAVAAVALLASGLWASGVLGGGDREWVLQDALAEIEELAREGLYDSAWVVLRHAEGVAPDEPALEEMWPLIAWTMGSLRTEPSGARVLRRPYGSSDDTPWESLGTTPIETFRLPYPNPLLMIEAEGYQASYLAPLGVGGVDWLTTFPLVTLDLEGEAPENMVRVPGLEVTIDGTAHALEDFYIDRFEVTNQEFQTFVDAGGYRNPQYWEHPFVLDGRTLSRDEAMEQFVDQTGRPGPSTWQVANYPDGQDDYPVTGVSWYEAAAYAKFAGKSLPSVHHWRRAYGTGLSLPYMLPLSNFAGDGPALVGEYTGMGPFGTFDMAGNAREWVFNVVGEDRYMLGGGWTDPDYVGVDVLSSQYTQPAFDRSPTNGFRLARYQEDGPGLQAALAPEAARTVVVSPNIPTVDDEVFEVYRRAYAYDRGELNSTVVEADTTRHWIRQLISFDAAYGDERVLLHLYLPLTATDPLQTVVYWGGSANLVYTSIDQAVNLHPNFIVQSGRALAFPVLKGTLERNDRFDAPGGSILERERRIQQVQDVRRTVDYLETRDEIDADALAYYGWSWGAMEGPLPLALEPRLKAGILDVAGFFGYRRQPEIDPVFFIPRTSVPILMLSGRLDALLPLETNARPFFDLLGTPEGQKHPVVSEAGHLLPMAEVMRESLLFLDRYLGPVGGG